MAEDKCYMDDDVLPLVSELADYHSDILIAYRTLDVIWDRLQGDYLSMNEMGIPMTLSLKDDIQAILAGEKLQ